MGEGNGDGEFVFEDAYWWFPGGVSTGLAPEASVVDGNPGGLGAAVKPQAVNMAVAEQAIRTRAVVRMPEKRTGSGVVTATMPCPG